MIASDAIDASSAMNVPTASTRNVGLPGSAETANGHAKVSKQADTTDAARAQRNRCGVLFTGRYETSALLALAE